LQAVATGAVGAASALAGCSGLDGGGRTPYDLPAETTTAETESVPDPDTVLSVGQVEAPAPAPPTYRRWLPAPAAFGAVSYPVRVLDVERVRALGAGVPDAFGVQRWFGRVGVDTLGVDRESYRRVLRLDGTRAVVVEADPDAAAVGDHLRETGYESVGRHRGRAVFARGDDPRAVAVGDGAVVFSNPVAPAADPVDVVRTVLDARAGAVDRYHEVETGFRRLSTAAGTVPAGALRTGTELDVSAGEAALSGVVGTGVTTAFDGATTYHRRLVVFESPRTAARIGYDLRRIAAADPALRAATAVAIRVDGRQATLVGAIPNERYTTVAAPFERVRYPQVTWSFDRSRRGEAVVVAVGHEGGAPVSAERLSATLDGRAVRLGVPDGDPVTPGDTLLVRVARSRLSPPADLVMTWRVPELTVSAVLGRYRLR
jgi:hypothetical protein